MGAFRFSDYGPGHGFQFGKLDSGPDAIGQHCGFLAPDVHALAVCVQTCQAYIVAHMEDMRFRGGGCLRLCPVRFLILSQAVEFCTVSHQLMQFFLALQVLDDPFGFFPFFVQHRVQVRRIFLPDPLPVLPGFFLFLVRFFLQSVRIVDQGPEPLFLVTYGFLETLEVLQLALHLGGFLFLAFPGPVNDGSRQTAAGCNVKGITGAGHIFHIPVSRLECLCVKLHAGDEYTVSCLAPGFHLGIVGGCQHSGSLVHQVFQHRDGQTGPFQGISAIADFIQQGEGSPAGAGHQA